MLVNPALQTAVGLAACGVADKAWWSVMVTQSERKLLSFSSTQLAQLAAAVGKR